MRGFNQVLSVDAQAGWVDTEGMITYEDLTRDCLAHGVMPAVVPQLKTITLGGAVAGVGIESSSHRYVTCTPTNEHADLFFGFPNSYGTLGYALRVKAKTVRVRPYVHLQHLGFSSAGKYFEELGQHLRSGANDFVDGTVFSPSEMYITLGRFTDTAPYTSDYTYENIYYRSIAGKHEDYLTVHDYIWRWDTDWFWCSKNVLAQNRFFRKFVFGRKRLGSKTYTKIMRWNSRAGLSRALDRLVGKHSESVIQDVDIPLENAPAFLETNEMSILLSVLATILLYALATAVTQSSDSLWLAGMRYASAVLPLTAMAAAIIIAKVGRGNPPIWLSLLLIFGLTKLAQLTPWVAGNPSGLIHFGKYSVDAHIPAKIVDRFLGTGLLKYVRDLRRENPGTVTKSCKFLRENAKPGDVVIVNYGMEPTYFYTRLPQAMGILPEYPVYPRARELRLPEFVFGPDHARWIVWRSAWETGPGYAINDVLRQISENGGKITTVMEMEETVWENREDIHFHRFSDGTYLFPRTQTFPMSRIARVDWL